MPGLDAAALQAALALDGGPADLDALGTCLPADAVADILVSIEALQLWLNAVSADNGGPPVTVHLTRSTHMRCGVTRLSPEQAIVRLPVGTLARLHVMHRLLLSYWGRTDSVPSLLASIRDRPFERQLPRALRPLLNDSAPGDDEPGWWAGLDAIDASIELDPAYAPDVGELNHLALSLLLGHEFAHMARQHTDVRRRVRAGELRFELGDGEARRPATDKELIRAMENDADRVSAYLAVLTLARQAQAAGHDVGLGFVRLGYALTALLALFDPQQISLMSFGPESAYAHPLLRQDAYLADATRCAGHLGLEAACEANSLHGARRCLDALAQLEFDVYRRSRFVTEGESFDPVLHALRGSEPNLLMLWRQREQEQALMLRLNTLISEQYGDFRFA